MTNQNNAAQAAAQILTYLGFAQAVSMEPAADPRRDHIQALIESALLSKLRAPVADERAACPTDVCQAGKADGVLCANDECDRANGVRPASAPVAGEAQPLGWIVREQRGQDGELLDCFVEAPRANNMPYALEVLGDDYTGYGDVEGKLKHCQMIVAWAKAAPQASEAVRWVVTDDMRSAVRFAPSSAHWSERLKEFFGPDAREGINALEKQLREARADLERQQLASEAVRDAAFSAGVKAAADLVKKMVDDYDADLGSTDPETGTREYPGEGATWVCEMQELEESIRALSAQPGAQRTGGSDV